MDDLIQRTREIGLRIALGVRPADILRTVLQRSLALTLGGIVVGTGAGIWSDIFSRSYLASA